MPPPLGFITPSMRTAAQHAAHANAVAGHVQFALPRLVLAKGESVRLFNGWKHPKVVADVGFEFDRIHQITGSCVWAGGTNAAFSTISTQRIAVPNPTKAFLPFLLPNYAMSRHAMGDDSQGEGSMGSTFAESLRLHGAQDWNDSSNPYMPKYDRPDGVVAGQQAEMAWSSYRNKNLQAALAVSKPHLFGATAECKSVDDIAAMVGNGYGVAFACNNYIGHAKVEGSGADACVIGYWEGRGGHQQSVHAVWEHPNFGRLFWTQNNWPKDTYPADPAGGPVCGCWVREAKVEAALRLDAEVYGYSHLSWFPANPDVPAKLDLSQF